MSKTYDILSSDFLRLINSSSTTTHTMLIRITRPRHIILTHHPTPITLHPPAQFLPTGAGLPDRGAPYRPAFHDVVRTHLQWREEQELRRPAAFIRPRLRRK